MRRFRAEQLGIAALLLAAVALVAVPLSHTDIEHADDCPLCHPQSHSFHLVDEVVVLDDAGPDRENAREISGAGPAANDYRLPDRRGPPLLSHA